MWRRTLDGVAGVLFGLGITVTGWFNVPVGVAFIVLAIFIGFWRIGTWSPVANWGRKRPVISTFLACVLGAAVFGGAWQLIVRAKQHTTLSRMSNQELRARAGYIVRAIQELLNDYGERDQRLLERRLRALDDKDKAAEQAIDIESTAEVRHLTKEYERKYGAAAWLICNEMLVRLGSKARRGLIVPDADYGDIVYRYPNNAGGLSEVAEDLKILALQLPDQ